MKPIRVLIVDDSKVFCRMLHDELKAFLPEGSEILMARDAFAAWASILSANPDVILLDQEMPRMDGICFLRWMKNGQVVIPTALMSGNPSYEKEALAAGAALFLMKPSGSFLGEAPLFAQQVKDSVARLAEMPVSLPELFDSDLNSAPEPVPEPSEPAVDDAPTAAPIELIAIGASTGGPEALAMLLAKLKPPLPPILIVQHIPAAFSARLADRLDIDSELCVTEAVDGVRVRPNNVYIAPGGKHLRVRRSGNEFCLSCTYGPRVNSVCPSIDVLFESVAQSAGPGALGVVLTGMGTDGARGLLRMRRVGAQTLGQDEASSAIYGIPRVAWEMGAVARQLPLQEMAGAITAIAQKNQYITGTQFPSQPFMMPSVSSEPGNWADIYRTALGS